MRLQKSQRTSRERIIVLTVLSMGVVTVIVLILCRILGFTPANHAYKFASARACLASGRTEINRFKELTGRCPASLDDVRRYAKENLNSGISGEFFKEFLSDRRGNGTEHAVIDGSGGLYYNGSTGELRINLTNELHHYLPLIRGKERKDVPAKW